MIWKILLFVLVTISATVVLTVFQKKIGLDFEKIVLPQLAPMIGFLVVVLLFKNLGISIDLKFNKLIAFKSLLALGLPLFLTSISYFIGKLNGLDMRLNNELTSLFFTMIIGILIGAIGEELGWRSFLQPTLEKRNSVLKASIITGFIWGFWHIGHYKNGLLFMIVFLIFTISASIILGWILRDTQYSIVLSVVFHTSINISFLVFFKNSIVDIKFMFTNAIVWMIFSIGVVIISAENLVRR